MQDVLSADRELDVAVVSCSSVNRDELGWGCADVGEPSNPRHMPSKMKVVA